MNDMKNFIIIFYLTTVITNLSCNSAVFSQSLKNDTLIQSYFSQNEINDLENILSFFNNEITKNCSGDLDKCYNMYFENIQEKFKKNDFGIPQEKEDILLKNIRQSTFDKIWSESIAFKNNRKDTADIIIMNINGQYMNFLKEYGSIKQFIYPYYYGIKITGDINAGSINSMILNYDKFNIKDEKDRLIIAIHYLTVNNHLKGLSTN
jgi:hypothetical protein